MIEHTDVAAYALGVLGEQDRRAFEAHLPGCLFCTRELADLRGMRVLLSEVEPPPRATVTDLPTRHRTTGRATGNPRSNLQRWLVSAAAGFVLILGGVTAGVGLSNHDTVPGIDMSKGVHRSAISPTTGAQGTAVLDDRTWGTWVALDMTNIRGPFDCELIAVAKSGAQRVASGWAVPAHGYGVPGAPAHLRIEGGVADRMTDLDRLEVRTSTGTTLLVIPV
ncbi:MAG: hypothetical protein ABIS86_12325 [Streptosporangiaceae bacterium]